MNIIIFGTGILGRRYFLETRENVLFFVDNDAAMWGRMCEGLNVKSPEVLLDVAFDKVVVAIANGEPVVAQLKQMGIPGEKIQVYTVRIKPRRAWRG